MATVRRLIGNIKGPKGDTGATGATGPQGPAGQDGAPGVNDYATTEAAGLVRVGDDFNINSSNGVLSIKNAFTRASALAKMVTDEAFATTLGKIAKAVDWVVDNAPNFFNKSTDIVDGFDSALTDKALSANAGKTLKTSIDSLNDSLTEMITDKDVSNVLSSPVGTIVVARMVKIGKLCTYTIRLDLTTAVQANSTVITGIQPVTGGVYAGATSPTNLGGINVYLTSVPEWGIGATGALAANATLRFSITYITSN